MKTGTRLRAGRCARAAGLRMYERVVDERERIDNEGRQRADGTVSQNSSAQLHASGAIEPIVGPMIGANHHHRFPQHSNRHRQCRPRRRKGSLRSDLRQRHHRRAAAPLHQAEKKEEKNDFWLSELCHARKAADDAIIYNLVIDANEVKVALRPKRSCNPPVSSGSDSAVDQVRRDDPAISRRWRKEDYQQIGRKRREKSDR